MGILDSNIDWDNVDESQQGITRPCLKEPT